MTIPDAIVNDLNKQFKWPVNVADKAYSPLFIDLVDDINQKTMHGDGSPDDNVKGYTMADLSRIALKSYGLTSLKTVLKANRPSGVTDLQIDNLFKKYEEEWK